MAEPFFVTVKRTGAITGPAAWVTSNGAALASAAAQSTVS